VAYVYYLNYFIKENPQWDMRVFELQRVGIENPAESVPLLNPIDIQE